jgi:hypothetical protein
MLFRTAFGLAIAWVISGCAVPLPATERLMAGTPIQAESTGFLVRHATTMAEVREKLGPPRFIWEDARLFVYHWDVRQAILVIAAPSSSAGGIGEIPQQRTFIVRFDAESRVASWGTAVWPLTKSLPDFLREWLKADDASTLPPLGHP